MVNPYNTSPDGLDRELVLEFFWKFAVFECALKREGFLHPTNPRNDAAEPDWKKFGKYVGGSFEKVRIAGFREAVCALLEASPRRQVVNDGQLGWKECQRKPQESQEEFVLGLVKVVRNNLFHGGKYPDGPIEEVARDKAILCAALKVLEGCYELHPGIARWVQGAA